MPLTEATSGLKFLLQADFIVQPGRRTLDYEATWNRWLMEELAELLRRAIKYLSDKFGTEYLPIFEYREIGGPVFEKLIKPQLSK